MKISLALGPRGNLSPQTAWGCLTANLALPGSGSLAAGRLSGYPQVALALVGLALTMAYGTRFVFWFLRNYSRLQENNITDPVGYIMEIWLAVRWALLGMGVFGLTWIWALITSMAIVRSAKSSGAPPPLV